MSKREVLQSYNNQNRFDILWGGERWDEQDNKDPVDLSRDKEVNEILAPFTYCSVSKKPKRKYIRKPGVRIHTVFDPPAPSEAVNMKDNQRVTEVDYFRMIYDSQAIVAMYHFSTRNQKCVISLQRIGNKSGQSFQTQHYENITV